MRFCLVSIARAEVKVLATDPVNQDPGDDYIENDLMISTAEEIREARPLATVFTERVMARAILIATTFHIKTPHDLPH